MSISGVLLIHVLTTTLAYLVLAFLLFLNFLYVALYLRLKDSKDLHLYPQNFSLDRLLKINFRLLYAFTVLLTVGLISGMLDLYNRSLVAEEKTRMLVLLVLWLLSIQTIYAQRKDGLQAKKFSYRVFLIVGIALIAFFYEAFAIYRLAFLGRM